MKQRWILSVTCVLALTVSATAAGVKLKYPKTERIDHFDTYHGVKVHDPYQWLEEDVRQSDRVRQWVQSQNQVTFDYLNTLPQRSIIHERLKQVWDYEKIGTPWKVGQRYFISRQDGLQNHRVIYTMDTPDGPRKVLFNPNEWSKDGTTALGGTSVSPNGTYAAYAIQEAGSDWRTWKIRNIETGKDCPDTFRYLKFTKPAWTADSRSVYYAKYPEPDPQKQFISLNKNMKVMHHRLGSDPANDEVVYYRPDHPDWVYDAEVTDDGRYLILTIHIGTDDKYRIVYLDLTNPGAQPVDLIDTFENEYTFIDNQGSIFYFLTDKDAVNRRLIAIDIRQPQIEQWQEIVPETASPLTFVNRIDNRFICGYLENVATSIQVFTSQGQPVTTAPFPELGTMNGFSGRNTDTETFYSYQSLTTPAAIYRYDMRTGQSTLLERTKVNFNPEQYISRQVFYASKDGTRIPMFITHKKGLALDGTNPTLLRGYGGFDVSLRPYFSATRGLWMEMGGVLASVNLRGGGEYGQAWHEAGKRMKKQNVFDDFIAAAEYLIAEKYTSSEKIAIQGGSNGGLLVGACMTQRPDLFTAAVPHVGVMDMLRYDQFTAGRFWIDEYGSAQENKAMFDYLKGYSPYHNLKNRTHYPATLIITADTDDRVVPGHSFKFAAMLQRAHRGSGPVLIRIETRAGHGSGKPTSLAIEEVADIYAFLAENLQMPLPTK